MGFYITEAEAQGLQVQKERALEMPDGRSDSFRASELVWRAYQFLVVCGRWDPAELVALALQKQQGASIAGKFPRAHAGEGSVSLFEIRLLEGPKVDPETLGLTASRNKTLSLDESFHHVVSVLYGELIGRLRGENLVAVVR